MEISGLKTEHTIDKLNWPLKGTKVETALMDFKTLRSLDENQQLQLHAFLFTKTCFINLP